VEACSPGGIPATASPVVGPAGICFDASGTMYLTDDRCKLLYKIDAGTWTIVTIAGTGATEYNGEGIPATTANLYTPGNSALDPEGNLVFAELQGNRVRKIDAVSGLISTIAGTGTAGYNADGISAKAAQLDLPSDVVIDSSGNIYIADTGNHRIRRVDAVTGLITTTAGTGGWEYNGEGVDALSTELFLPCAVVIGPDGDIYVSEYGGDRIRRITSGPAGGETQPAVSKGSLIVASWGRAGGPTGYGCSSGEIPADGSRSASMTAPAGSPARSPST